jgi:hypothetical protein
MATDLNDTHINKPGEHLFDVLITGGGINAGKLALWLRKAAT